MSKPVLHSFALASLAAGSLGSAAAAPISPTFNCLSDTAASAGGNVSWGANSTVFAPTLTFDFFDNSVDPDITSKLDCNGGVFSETVARRKSGEGQKDFLTVTMKEVFRSGFTPANTDHIKVNFTQALGASIDGVQTYDAYWDLTGDYLLSNLNGGFTAQSNFLGFKLQTTQKFEGMFSFNYDYEQKELVFSAEMQQRAGTLSLTSSPRELAEPTTLTLLGTGLLGAVAMRRRRRGW